MLHFAFFCVDTENVIFGYVLAIAKIFADKIHNDNKPPTQKCVGGFSNIIGFMEKHPLMRLGAKPLKWEQNGKYRCEEWERAALRLYHGELCGGGGNGGGENADYRGAGRGGENYFAERKGGSVFR